MNHPVTAGKKDAFTPQKKPLAVPTQALADAIAEEWKGQKAFSAAAMPLTALAYTAIDRIEDKKEDIIEVLMVYVDTDTLSYRSDSSQAMIDRQKKEWEPVRHWAGREFGAIWQTVSGIEPAVQPAAMHDAIRAYLETLDAMRLSAACVLASTCSSILLTLAVLKKHLDAETAFALSRLEEEVQAEQWGRDEEAGQRIERVKAEIRGISRFLRLLEGAKIA